MKIIIAGGGTVGGTLARVLVQEGHDLTLIDTDPGLIYRLSGEMDIICVEGSAANPETLREAGAADADIVIAVTERDEVNMVCGITARRLGAKDAVARIRNPEYLHQREFFRETMGLSLIINPEFECAREIARILRFPAAERVDSFSKSGAELVEYRVRKGSSLADVQLRDLPQKYHKVKFLVCAVQRGDMTLIPKGDFTIKEGDLLSLVGSSSELRRLFSFAGARHRPVKDVIIMGGGRITGYLARLLENEGIQVSVADDDAERCAELAEAVPQAHIICGDATDKDVLLEEGLRTVESFVALTDDDGDNIINSMYASSIGVKKVVTKVDRGHYADILTAAGLDTAIRPRDVIAQQIARYVRAVDIEDSGIETLYRIAGGKAEALEFRVGPGLRCTGRALKDMKLKKNVLIAAIIRDGKTLIPGGLTEIMPGDRAIVVTNGTRLRDIDGILDEGGLR